MKSSQGKRVIVVACELLTSDSERRVMEERDYYEVLQLHPSADHAMVVQSYWYLARKYKAAMDRGRLRGARSRGAEPGFEVLGSPDSRAITIAKEPRWLRSLLASRKSRSGCRLRSRSGAFRPGKGCFRRRQPRAGRVALAAGAALWAVLPLAAIAVGASLVTLPSHFASSKEARHHLGPRHWRRDLRVVERLDRNLGASGQLAFTPRRR